MLAVEDIRSRNWLVWNLPDDVIGLVYQFSFFILPISASLVVWERTSFVSALILFIVFHLSECLSCSCFVYHQSLLKLADRQCFDKLYLVIDFPFPPLPLFLFSSFVVVVSVLMFMIFHTVCIWFIDYAK